VKETIACVLMLYISASVEQIRETSKIEKIAATTLANGCKKVLKVKLK